MDHTAANGFRQSPGQMGHTATSGLMEPGQMSHTAINAHRQQSVDIVGAGISILAM